MASDADVKTESPLLELAGRCEAATGPDEELERAIALAVYGMFYHGIPNNVPTQTGYIFPRYTASLDAAMTLVPEGWLWARDIDQIFCLYSPESSSPEIGFHESCDALALCAAALRARAVS